MLRVFIDQVDDYLSHGILLNKDQGLARLEDNAVAIKVGLWSLRNRAAPRGFRHK